jgi:hypothetical protein
LVKAVSDVLPVTTSDAASFYHQSVDCTANADWVLLEFQDKITANDQGLPFVHSIIDGLPSVGTDCMLHGFPGGSLGFAGHEGAKNNTVTPRQILEQPKVKLAAGGLVELTGDQTREGMSGGGVFEKDSGSLIALHRAKRVLALELHAVSLHQITCVLKERFEFEPAPEREWSETGDANDLGGVPDPHFGPRLKEPLRELCDLLGAIPEPGLRWRRAFVRALPRSSTFELPAAAREGDTVLSAALQELAGFGADAEGVLPLFRFGYELTRSPRVKGRLKRKLADWLKTHCPTAQREELSKSRPVKKKGEPRIVVQMTPPEEGEAYAPCGPALSPPPPREALFSYTTWFIGFPNPPAAERYTDTLKGFPCVLEHAWSAVCDQHDPRFVWVELFLPKELLPWAVEQEQVRIVKLASPVLGARHRFVLRFDRVDYYSKQLESRWNDARRLAGRLKKPIRLDYSLPPEDVPDEAGDERHFVVALNGNPSPEDVQDMQLLLEAKRSVLGVLWESPPPVSGPGDVDAWDAAFESGVPLIVWLRVPSPEPNDDADPRKVFQQKEWDQLADEVRRIRLIAASRKKDPWHVGRHLAVLLDDPRRPLPEDSQGTGLRSPTSPH